MKIVFFGTSYFAANILRFLLSQNYNVVAIVTKPDRPQGRRQKLTPTAVKTLALEVSPHIDLHQPKRASDPAFVSILKEYRPDLFLVVAYGEIIKQNLLDLPTKAAVNIHASLLPEYRGAAPMQRVLMDGRKKSGVTFIKMVLALDAGDMLARKETPIDDDMTLGELQEKLISLSCDLIPSLFKKIENGDVEGEVQDSKKVTFAAKITATDQEISWERDAWVLHNTIRAFSPLPSAWCFIFVGDEKKRLKILRSKPISCVSGPVSKIMKQTGSELHIACKSGCLALLEVQLEGKKPMKIADFLRGLNKPLSFSL